MANRPLTDKQLGVLRHIYQCVQENGFPPSIREMGVSFGIGTTRGVTVHLDALECKGMLHREGVGARCLTVTEAGKRALGEYPELPGNFVYFVYDEASRCMQPWVQTG